MNHAPTQLHRDFYRRRRNTADSRLRDRLHLRQNGALAVGQFLVLAHHGRLIVTLPCCHLAVDRFADGRWPAQRRQLHPCWRYRVAVRWSTRLCTAVTRDLRGTARNLAVRGVHPPATHRRMAGMEPRNEPHSRRAPMSTTSFRRIVALIPFVALAACGSNGGDRPGNMARTRICPTLRNTCCRP